MDPKISFEDLYLQNVERIFAFCAARAGRQQAEDLTADVFCKALAAWGRFEVRDSSPRAWLMQIAYNRIVEDWRSGTPGNNNLVAQIAIDDVAIVVEEMDQNEMVLTRLRELPERQQVVVTLRFLSELSVAEVANVLEITEEAVRSATMRGIRTLRRAISGTPQWV